MKLMLFAGILAALIFPGTTAAGTRHLTVDAAYLRIAGCAQHLGAIQTRQDGDLGGEAWFGSSGHNEIFATGHFEWGYVKGEYGRVLNFTIIEDQGAVPMRRLERCLETTKAAPTTRAGAASR